MVRARGEMGMLAGFVATVVAVALLLLLLFAAWGRATTQVPDPGAKQILFTGWGGVIERQVFTELVAEFERRHPDIDVVYRPVPRDYVNKLKVMVAGGTPPDVFYIPDGDFAGFAVRGQLLDLDPFVRQSTVINPDEIWESGLRRYRWNGHVVGRGPQYAIPKDIGPSAMYVNLDLLRSEGITPPPADRALTWTEAETLWKRLTRDLDGDGRTDQWGLHGFVMEAAIWSHRGEILSPDCRRFILPENRKGLEALQWVASLQRDARVAMQEATEREKQAVPVDTMFLTGRLATLISGRWMVPLFRNAEFEWDVVPVPVSPVTREPAGWSGSVGLAISPACRYKEAAWKLIEFLSGPEGQAVQARTGFQIPNQKSLSRTEVFLQPNLRPAHPEVFIEAAEYQQAGFPTLTPDHEWFDIMQRELGPAYRGEKRVRDVIRTIEDDVQAALDRSWKVAK